METKKYFPSYSINLSKEDVMNKYEFLSNLRGELTEYFIDFDYVTFVPVEGKDGRVYIVPAFDLPINIAGEEYSIEEILSPSFFKDYSDGSDFFKEEYEEAVSHIKREIKEATPMLRDFASSWGFRKDKNSKVVEAYGNSNEKVTISYDDLYIDIMYGIEDKSVGLPEKDWSGYVSFDYDVDKDDVIDVLVDYVIDNIEDHVVDGTAPEEMKELIDEATEKQLIKYVTDNFDRLFDMYYTELQGRFRKDATEKAAEKETQRLNDYEFYPDDSWY